MSTAVAGIIVAGIIVAVIAAAVGGVYVYQSGVRVCNDERRYLSMHKVPHVAVPFSLRWLLPMITRGNRTAWYVVSLTCAVMLPVAVYAYALTRGLSTEGALAAGVALTALSNYRLMWVLPGTTDSAAMLGAVTSAAMLSTGEIEWVIAGYALAAVFAACRESVPVFTALFAWNPIVLFTLVVPLIVWSVRRLIDNPDNIDQLGDPTGGIGSPFATGRKFHAKILTNSTVMLFPWGIGLFALVEPTIQLAATALAAYAQVFVATDTTRLYMWAAPVVLTIAVTLIPVSLLPAALVLHFFITPRVNA